VESPWLLEQDGYPEVTHAASVEGFGHPGTGQAVAESFQRLGIDVAHVVFDELLLWSLIRQEKWVSLVAGPSGPRVGGQRRDFEASDLVGAVLRCRADRIPAFRRLDEQNFAVDQDFPISD
jgi:hypothetical protein